MAYYIPNECFGCATCFEKCPAGAIYESTVPGDRKFVIDPSRCIECGICRKVCWYDFPVPPVRKGGTR